MNRNVTGITINQMGMIPAIHRDTHKHNTSQKPYERCIYLFNETQIRQIFYKENSKVYIFIRGKQQR